MTNEGEVMVGLGMKDIGLADGLRGASSRIAGWAKGVKSEFKGITAVAKTMKLAMKGFGIIGIISTVEHVYDLISGLVAANKEAETFSEWMDKARKSAEDTLKAIKELRVGNMSPEDRLSARKEELGTANRGKATIDIDLAKKTKELEEYEKNLSEIDSKFNVHSRETAEYQKHIEDHNKAVGALEQKRLESVKAIAEAQKKVGDAQKEVNADREKAETKADQEDKKDAEEQQKRHTELHRLYMFHLSVQQAKQSEVKQQADMLFAARMSFSPTHDQILNSGAYERHGHLIFRRSYASQRQQAIDNATSSFQNDIANYGYSGAGGDQRRIGIENMQKELSEFLHGPGYKTNEEKMLDEQKTANRHLQDIRDAFYQTEAQ